MDWGEGQAATSAEIFSCGECTWCSRSPTRGGGLVRKPGELGKQVADHLLGLGSPETH